MRGNNNGGDIFRRKEEYYRVKAVVKGILIKYFFRKPDKNSFILKIRRNRPLRFPRYNLPDQKALLDPNLQ